MDEARQQATMIPKIYTQKVLNPTPQNTFGDLTSRTATISTLMKTGSRLLMMASKQPTSEGVGSLVLAWQVAPAASTRQHEEGRVSLPNTFCQSSGPWTPQHFN